MSANLHILAYPIRLQSIDLLMQCEGQVCGCNLEAVLPLKQPTASHHLKQLREAGLIDGERRRQCIHSSVRQPALDALCNCLANRAG